MMFYLTTLNLARFLTENALKLKEDEQNDEAKIAIVNAWNSSDYLCRNYIMNGLADSLYNVYISMGTAKELWESLVKNIKQRMPLILHEIHAKGMQLGEGFQVACAIEKLSPAWKDFKNYLKHKRKEMSMEDLEVRLCIEEDNRGFEKKATVGGYSAKANVVKHGQSSKTKKFKNQGSKLGPRGGIAKKARFEGKCFNCDKTGHKAVDCNKPK
ncbi:hypothetical protein ACLB2K_062574 [Fragaria x ananassa]